MNDSQETLYSMRLIDNKRVGPIKILPDRNQQKYLFEKAYESAFINNQCNDKINIAYFLNADYFDGDEDFKPRYKSNKINPFRDDTERNINYMLQKRSNYGVLVLVDKDLVSQGFVLFEHMANDSDILYLDIICTRPGFGSVILKAFIEFAQSIGASSIRLHSLFNVTRYYSKFGFDYGTNCNDRIVSSNANSYAREIYNGADEFIKEYGERIKAHNSDSTKKKIEWQDKEAIRDPRWLRFINYLQSNSINASIVNLTEPSTRKSLGRNYDVQRCKNVIVNDFNRSQFLSTCTDTGYDMILCLGHDKTDVSSSLRSRINRARVLRPTEESFMRSKIRSTPRQNEIVSVGRNKFHIIKPHM